MDVATRTRVLLDLDPAASDGLDEVARAMASDRVTVINEAIQTYLELFRWQSEHIQQGIKEADAGEFASDEELAEIFRQHR